MATIGSLPTGSSGPVLTEAQAKILDRLKSISGASGYGGKRTTAEATAAINIDLPALQLAAGSAEATGDVQGAQYVARQTKKLADDLRSALKDAAAAAPVNAGAAQGSSSDQLATTAKQLKLLLVKSRIALAQPQAQQSSPALRRAVDVDLREGEKAVQALQAQLRGGSGSAVNIRA
ncbi:MAG: hypothetical protein HYR63_16575 [Proteobacteria bacterium]|nr:hypothetical protein [Pseudomonadota bacterium]MBI3497685.1 hypothetical protein [Pseudomonadota bacterium]